MFHKVLAAAAAVLALLTATQAPASAASEVFDVDSVFLVKTKEADFGSGKHSWGRPTGSAGLDWYDETRLVLVPRSSGRPGFTTVTETMVHLYGTLYWDSLGPGCAELLVTFYASSQGGVFGDPLHTEQEQVCGPGWNANDPANKVDVNLAFRHADVDLVSIQVSWSEGPGRTTHIESQTFRAGDSHTQV